jgi:hypothetical protein
MDYEFLHSSENVNIAQERSVKSVKNDGDEGRNGNARKRVERENLRR